MFASPGVDVGFEYCPPVSPAIRLPMSIACIFRSNTTKSLKKNPPFSIDIIAIHRIISAIRPHIAAEDALTSRSIYTSAEMKRQTSGS